ncbi:N-acetylmuramoyl-L-alanine amidase [Pseudanabaena sp. Chao 1811]|uniref:N-acetylmuramoyl-L-alanine amidase n=1 Tax=Pseudanabaena sp. Chao 1811 TaxID=2963092 RepID=UPI0022F3FDCB|nr:N-acetylmuramoyl-L-alanine amidase [Pseudanabaena sp. Chao 1811]
MATNYAWNLGNPSSRVAYGLDSHTLPTVSGTNQTAKPSNLLAPAIAQNTSDLSNSIRLNSIRPTTNGLMLTLNANPEIRIQREANPNRLIVDLQNTAVVKELHKSSLLMNRFGVKQVRIAQFQNNPAIARLVFDLDSNDPNSKVAWQSQYIAATNTLLLTPANLAQTPVTTSLPIPVSSNPINTSKPASIQRLSFSNTGQLIIEANQPVNYQTSLDRVSGTFNLRVANANISPTLQRPTLLATSPIERIRLSQVGNAVEIGIKTSPSWQIREIQRQNNQQINLQVASNLPSNNPSESLPAPNRQGLGVIVVDPGHGGPDVGATRNGIYEKDINLEISKYLGGILQQMGYSVIYTRTNDIDLDLEPRVQIAENARADAFVSVHVNSLDVNASSVSGVETYHARGSTVGQELARYVHSQIIASTGASDRNIRGAGFYVIAKTSMPAILVETGYITNPAESSNLTSPNYQRRMAEAIAKGIDQFFKSNRR